MIKADNIEESHKAAQKELKGITDLVKEKQYKSLEIELEDAIKEVAGDSFKDGTLFILDEIINDITEHGDENDPNAVSFLNFISLYKDKIKDFDINVKVGIKGKEV